MPENPVKTRLAQGRAAFGGSCGVADPFANQIAISTGIDFLWIDTEHSNFGLDDVQLIPILCRQHGCMPMVRVAGNDPQLIKKALDLGSSGLMIPQIETAEEARAAVKAAMYAPEGSRGVSPNWTFYMNIPWDTYLPEANKELLLVLQIESARGFANIEEIAAVPGVDVLFLGAMDLSASLGVPGQPGHPSVKQHIAEFPGRVAAAGKIAGASLGSAEAARDAFDLGYRFLSIGNLMFSGANGLKAGLELLRAHEG